MLERLVSYQQARAEPQLRQVYLDSLLPIANKSVSRLIYDPTGESAKSRVKRLHTRNYLSTQEANNYFAELETNQVCLTVIVGKRTINDKKQHPVYAFPCAFDEFESENQFLSVAIDHEGAHTDQNHKGLQEKTILQGRCIYELPVPVFNHLLEFDAYSRQYSKLSRWNFPDESFKAEIFRRLTLREIALDLALRE